jgi:UDP:flavonoid glycosyltransferase YjiC (YdhE family)
MTRKRILFFAEAVTLAHAARPYALARALDPDRYEVHFACPDRYRHLLSIVGFQWHELQSMESCEFLQKLAKGEPVYDAAKLRAYVREDREIIERANPDLIIGDFRLSLAVSAPLAQKTYLAIANAYWSPYAKPTFTVPDIPLARILGVTAAQYVFNNVRSLVFGYHTLPLNRVRRENGLPGLGLDLRRVYTHADYTLYADIPELIPTFGLPANHRYLGPIPWSPDVPLPSWWDDLPTDKPLVYVTLGSSGAGRLLNIVAEALAGFDVTVVASTAGGSCPKSMPKNIFVSDYLPGEQVAARSCLVICNGGSPTTQQGLCHGVPIIGIAGNLDQYLNMFYLEKAGVGLCLRAASATSMNIADAVSRIINWPEFLENARRFERAFAKYNATQSFNELLTSLL